MIKMAIVRRSVARFLPSLPLFFLSGALASPCSAPGAGNRTCELSPPVLSCSAGAQPGLVDSCCVETFGGLVLATQFWNTYTGLESEGQVLPKDQWTIHGLWPDFCNGSYTQYCDLSRQYDPEPSPNTTTGKPDGTPVEPYVGPGIDELIEPLGRWDLLAHMRRHWTGQNQRSAVLWAHEYSKHATCFSTFGTRCYHSFSGAPAPHTPPAPAPGHDAAIIADYFATTVTYHARLPTWSWLAARDIVPSNTTAYSLSDVQDALAAGFGGPVPYIGCSGPRYNATGGGDDAGYTVISEVWYYYHVYGRVQEGRALPVPADVAGGRLSNCAKAPGALRYPERTVGSEV